MMRDAHSKNHKRAGMQTLCANIDRNDIDRVVRNAREENLKEVEEGLSKWISSVLDFRGTTTTVMTMMTMMTMVTRMHMLHLFLVGLRSIDGDRKNIM
mmetsp:Transcript_34342/g.55268  ORF Transcript_34342/g.55268 Transcript_34342/m.55268 type:complete len:98 (+) Transcript_34342:370-663(+)